MFFKGRGAGTIGLDLGSHSLKLVEMDHSGKVPSLVNYGVTELLPGTIRDGQIVDRPAVIQAINTLFDSVGMVNRQVSVALGTS